MRIILSVLILVSSVYGQSTTGAARRDLSNTYAAGQTQTFLGVVNAGEATRTRPVKVGTAVPGTCTIGDLFYDSDATAGANLFGCTATNTWTLETGGGGGGAISAITGGTEDAVPVGNGTTFTVKVLPSCSGATTDKLLYNSATNTFSCGADQSSGAPAISTVTGGTQDSVPVGNGTTFTVAVLPSCSGATTDKLLYNSTTNTFSCGADQSAGSPAITTVTGGTQDGLPVGNGSTFTVSVVPSCSDTVNSKLLYNSATNAFSCGSDQNSGGGSAYNVGPSGALAIDTVPSPDEIDIVTSVVPLKASANIWTGANTFFGASKFSMRGGTSDPGTCDATVREMFFNSTTNLLKSCNTTNVWTAISGAGGGYATIQDEGTPLTQRGTVNFTGAGVTCVDNGGATKTDCTITSGGGSVTSVGFTGGLISVATPTTTPALTVAGTSGGMPYFNTTTSWLSSALLTQRGVMLGGGAGAGPTALSSLGTTGQVLTSNGAGVDPSWQAAGAGAANPSVLISSTTQGISAATSATSDTTLATYTLPTLVTGDKVCINTWIVHTGTATTYVLRQKLAGSTITTTSGLGSTSTSQLLDFCFVVTGASAELVKSSLMSFGGPGSANNAGPGEYLFAPAVTSSGAAFVVSGNFSGATSDTIAVAHWEITKYAKTP